MRKRQKRVEAVPKNKKELGRGAEEGAKFVGIPGRMGVRRVGVA
jgi:hypothetical protein